MTRTEYQLRCSCGTAVGLTAPGGITLGSAPNFYLIFGKMFSREKKIN